MPVAKERRAELRKLLLTEGATTQLELARRLADRGYPANQSTISRDLRLLGARRQLRADGVFTYRLPPASSHGFPQDMVTDIEHNESMVVVRTLVGRAQAVGVELDNLANPMILGTLAGDDNVLVIPRSVHQTGALADFLRDLVERPEPMMEIGAAMNDRPTASR